MDGFTQVLWRVKSGCFLWNQELGENRGLLSLAEVLCRVSSSYVFELTLLHQLPFYYYNTKLEYYIIIVTTA